jgi:hypothetical protein
MLKQLKGGKQMKKDLNKMTLTELKAEIEQVEKAKKMIGKTQVKGSAYVIGANYMIRTVTMIYTGKLINVFDKELVLTNCAWIAETERWANTCLDGTFKEVEPYPKTAEVIINKEAILDSFIVSWKLPEVQK